MISLTAFLAAQLLAHTLTDFYLQPQTWADAKERRGFAAPSLYAHILLTFAFAWLLSFRLDYGYYAAGLALSHLLMDGLKVHLAKLRGLRGWLFFIDQTYHVAAIIATVYLFHRYVPAAAVPVEHVSRESLLLMLGIALCVRPANFAIRELLIANRIEIRDTIRREPAALVGVVDENAAIELPGAGRLIGSVERLLAFTLILIGQFSAVGFILAAKSILRYREGDSARTEYVLVGSLLSFAIALALGLILR